MPESEGRATFRPGRWESPTVLVTAASLHGSTARIAEEIAAELIGWDLSVAVIPPGQVTSLAGYDAVVVGSAVYAGHWQDDATGLVRRQMPALAERPVWLFSSGPVGTPGGKLARAMAKDPAELAELTAATRARGHRIFAGKLDPASLTFRERLTVQFLLPGMEGDFRDWGAIRRWADAIARQLTPTRL